MTVTVRLFSVARQRAGVAQLELHLRDGATMADARDALLEKYPPLRPYAGQFAYALNQQYTALTAVLNEGDELAFIPPVSGG